MRKRKSRDKKNYTNQAQPHSIKMRRETTEGYLTTVTPKIKGNNVTKLGAKSPAKWTAVNLCNAYRQGIRDFTGCDLSRLNLHNAKLSGANFYRANLREANLQGADLSDANLGHADLTNTILKNFVICMMNCVYMRF